jgi:hypothetical protein
MVLNVYHYPFNPFTLSLTRDTENQQVIKITIVYNIGDFGIKSSILILPYQGKVVTLG